MKAWKFRSIRFEYIALYTLLFCVLFSPHSLFAASSSSGEEFGFLAVAKQAQDLASKPYIDPQGTVPEILAKLSYDEWRDIRFIPEKALWKDGKRSFSVQFFHLGMIYNRAVHVHIVDRGKVEDFPFSTDLFDYGKNILNKKALPSDLGFAGFRIHYPINTREYSDEVVAFLGASYFRAVAQKQQYGLSARGLAVDTALPSGEEFPWFKEFWLVKPAINAQSMVIYALLDSPSCTGAYKFTLTPGDETTMDVICTVFKRKDALKLGIAPLTSMFFYGETSNGQPGDFRPEVHDSDGLLVATDDGRWIWRPLINPNRLLISEYKGYGVKGFGLMQRDVNFDHYQDLEARYEKRPSLWIIAGEEWKKGHVELIEIPTDSEINDNIVAFWVPEMKIGNSDIKGQSGKKGELPIPLTFTYTMKWGYPSSLLKSEKPALAAHTRSATEKAEGVYRFIIDFEGEELNKISAETGLASDIKIEGDGTLLEKQLLKNPETGGWRLSFRIAVPIDKLKSVVPDRKPVVKLSAFLKKGENIPEPLTEIWTYDFRP